MLAFSVWLQHICFRPSQPCLHSRQAGERGPREKTHRLAVARLYLFYFLHCRRKGGTILLVKKRNGKDVGGGSCCPSQGLSITWTVRIWGKGKGPASDSCLVRVFGKTWNPFGRFEIHLQTRLWEIDVRVVNIPCSPSPERDSPVTQVSWNLLCAQGQKYFRTLNGMAVPSTFWGRRWMLYLTCGFSELLEPMFCCFSFI